MAAPTGIFQKCIPAYRTSIKRCGSVTICDVGLPSESDLSTIFYDSNGNPRINDALFAHDLELKACQIRQNTMYDWLMANKVNLPGSRLTMSSLGGRMWEIAPFIKALRKGIINNNYWIVSNGQSNGGNWQVDVVSSSGIPSDISFFQVAGRVHIFGQSAGGSRTATQWAISGDPTLVTSGGITYVRLVLISQNTASAFPAAKLGNPVTGYMALGTPNVSDYESFCNTVKGLNTNVMDFFWLETTRSTLCMSEQYEKFQKLLYANNPEYALFGDIPEIELNKQAGADFQNRIAWQFFYGKPLVNQTTNGYTSLEQIVSPVSGLALADEGKCVGRRANMVGVYEQLQNCGRVYDLQGNVLNLAEFHQLLYEIMRFRESMGFPNPDTIDVVTDTFFAKQIDNAYIQYFIQKAGNNMFFTQAVDGREKAKEGVLGFKYRSYELDWPTITLNVMTHKFFDDQVDVAKRSGLGTTGRILACIDWQGVYPGVVGTNRVVNSSGDLALLAKVNADYACRMAVNKTTYTHTSATMAAIVECPQSSFWMEGISDARPDFSGAVGPLDYYG